MQHASVKVRRFGKELSAVGSAGSIAETVIRDLSVVRKTAFHIQTPGRLRFIARKCERKGLSFGRCRLPDRKLTGGRTYVILFSRHGHKSRTRINVILINRRVVRSFRQYRTRPRKFHLKGGRLGRTVINAFPLRILVGQPDT